MGDRSTPQAEDNVHVSRGARRGAILLLALVLIMGGGALLSSWLEYHHFATTQQQQGRLIDARLCATLSKLAALKPPAGSAKDNPSRAYEQQLAMTLAQLRPDIGCDP
jgi:hypothetical protein